jgi:hypothetical protein
MYSCDDTLSGGLPHSDIHGSTPARGSPWLFAACHVLHRLLVPRHPPNALLILDIPDFFPKEEASPCTETILSISRQLSVVSCQKQPRSEPPTAPRQSWKYPLRTLGDNHTVKPGGNGPRRACTTGFPWARLLPIACAIIELPDPTKSFTAPLNPRRRPLGRRSCEQQFPVRQFGRTTHPVSLQFPIVRCQNCILTTDNRPLTTAMMTRPETHQNLIHIAKEQTRPPANLSHGATAHTA